MENHVLRRKEICVGPTAFSLTPQWTPHFFKSRLATDRGPYSRSQDRIEKTPFSQRLDEMHHPFRLKPLLFQSFLRFVQHRDRLQRKCSTLSFPRLQAVP